MNCDGDIIAKEELLKYTILSLADRSKQLEDVWKHECDQNKEQTAYIAKLEKENADLTEETVRLRNQILALRSNEENKK